MSALHSAVDSTDTATDTPDRTGNRALSRRGVLGAVGAGLAAAVAGCTAQAGRDHGSPETTLVDRTAEVEPGQYGSFRFELSAEHWVTVEAALSDRSVDVKQDGPAVDVVVMTAAGFERFRDGGPFAFRPAVSMPGVVTGGVSGTLPTGEYVLVVDNSGAGPSDPGGSAVPAVVDLAVTAAAGRGATRVGARPGAR